MRLKLIGLARTLSAISVTKTRMPRPHGDTDLLLCRAMAAFGRAARIATTLDNCLGQSIAVAHHMLALGLIGAGLPCARWRDCNPLNTLSSAAVSPAFTRRLWLFWTPGMRVPTSHKELLSSSTRALD
jgi:hypothetical protein